MKHKVFIPVTDEMLYEHPELITAPLRPYQVDNPCFHWMATIESPEDAKNDPCVNMRFDHRTPITEISKINPPAIRIPARPPVLHATSQGAGQAV